jgi:hypothetical protein
VDVDDVLDGRRIAARHNYRNRQTGIQAWERYDAPATESNNDRRKRPSSTLTQI